MAENDSLPILIVEDDEPTQRLLQAVLRRSGYSSETTPNGGSAISLLQQNAYAAIVLDMMMPEVGGRDVIQYLETERDTTPVIICSAATPSVYADVNRAVVKAVVRKPFDVDEFLATVTAVASRR